ncbi:hypothetical protein IPJ70_00210 [Candidatus Campbellbacteria bacterium]|nr:MAG: hypothetical protein IPJ70_00210 [Candidatus Campbellbacteria bacterium]
MGNKIAFFFLALVGTCLLGLIGWVVLATYGGNYAEDFIAFGLRGYEATGFIGQCVGLVLGVVMTIYIYQKNFKKNVL